MYIGTFWYYYLDVSMEVRLLVSMSETARGARKPALHVDVRTLLHQAIKPK